MITGRLLVQLTRTGLFHSLLYSKVLALGLLVLSLLGARGKPEATLRRVPMLRNAKDGRPFKPLPVVAAVTQQAVLDNYFSIKREVEGLIEREIEVLLNTPGGL